MGDLPIGEFGNKTPLEAAQTPNLDKLAKRGKTGLMFTAGKGIAPESDVGVIAILGYDPYKHVTGRGIIEALGAGLSVKDGDLAIRCNLATLGEGKQIIDRRAGRDLTSEESLELGLAVNKSVKLQSFPASFEFKSTVGHRAVLVIKSRTRALSSRITNTDPAYNRLEGMGIAEEKFEMRMKKCRPIDRSASAKISAELVNEFVQKSHEVLDDHEVNDNRVASGKLKANVILTRDAGHILPKFHSICERYHVRFTSLVDMPVERGIAELAGMSLVDLPQPSSDLKSDLLFRAQKLLGVLPSSDCFYIHLKGPDEPGHDGDFQLKKHLISMIDRYFFGEVLKKIRISSHLICVTSDHSTPCALQAHSDDPVPVLISGNKISGDEISVFSERECLRGSLGVLQKGTELMPLLMKLRKSEEEITDC